MSAHPFGLLVGDQPTPPDAWPDDKRTFNSLSDSEQDSPASRMSRNLYRQAHGMPPAPKPTPAPKVKVKKVKPVPDPDLPPMPPSPGNKRRRFGLRIVYDDNPTEYVLPMADGTSTSYRLALPRIEFCGYDEPPPEIPEELHPYSTYISRRRRRIVDVLKARLIVSAETLARELNVTMRTIYRDVSELQLMGLPIASSAGRGYSWTRR